MKSKELFLDFDEVLFNSRHCHQLVRPQQTGRSMELLLSPISAVCLPALPLPAARARRAQAMELF